MDRVVASFAAATTAGLLIGYGGYMLGRSTASRSDAAPLLGGASAASAVTAGLSLHAVSASRSGTSRSAGSIRARPPPPATDAPTCPIIVGIAGASGSGKTSIAELISARIYGGAVVSISCDNYYRSVSSVGTEGLRLYSGAVCYDFTGAPAASVHSGYLLLRARDTPYAAAPLPRARTASRRSHVRCHGLLQDAPQRR